VPRSTGSVGAPAEAPQSLVVHRRVLTDWDRSSLHQRYAHRRRSRQRGGPCRTGRHMRHNGVAEGSHRPTAVAGTSARPSLIAGGKGAESGARLRDRVPDAVDQKLTSMCQGGIRHRVMSD